MNPARDLPRLGAVLAILVLAGLPMARLPAFYDSFLYLVFFWVSLSTSWALLSGFAGYFSLGHAAFYGAGMYTTAVMSATLKRSPATKSRPSRRASSAARNRCSRSRPRLPSSGICT